MFRSWIALFLAVLIWSVINPHDYFTWMLEVLPALIGLVVLVATREQFPLTRLAYGLLLWEFVILMIGGHYTYAEVPLFNALKDVLHQDRNNYDKLAHFFQGFVPAVVAREIFIRLRVIDGRWWRGFLVVCFCLALSAFYELIEWLVAVWSGTAADAFLGTQDDAWDTQTDMAMALLGAITALGLLSRLHDRQLAMLEVPSAAARQRDISEPMC